jgi:isopentenyl-diphosphate delta-isomerase
MASAEAMILDRVNESDQPVGTVKRADVFAVGASFRVAHVFIFDNTGKLLLQQLAQSRLRHPGRWGSSLAAYVAAGEDYGQAVHRRLPQELGIDLDLRFITRTRMLDENCSKFITLYFADSSGPFTTDPSHIADLAFMALTDVRDARDRDPWHFTPTFLYLWDLCTEHSLISIT